MLVQGLFYLSSVFLLACASLVITVRNPVHAALFLILCFFSMAVIWLLLLAEFLAIILVLVYVGAVMVLFLFIVMLLDIDFAVLRAGFAGYLWPSLLVATIMAVLMGAILGRAPAPFVPGAVLEKLGAADNTLVLGKALFTEHLYAFEIAGALLLVAIVAAITLTARGRKKGNRSPDAHVQLRAEKADRLRVVSLSPTDGLSPPDGAAPPSGSS